MKDFILFLTKIDIDINIIININKYASKKQKP